MKLYKIPGAPAGARFHSSKTGLKDFVEIELPKDGRAGMAAFFNDNERELVGVGLLPPRQLDALEQAEMRAVAAAEQSTTVSSHAQRPVSTADIEGFILNSASVAQVEDIFASLGTRFKELANDRRGS
jgi:hypothetical protein